MTFRGKLAVYLIVKYLQLGDDGKLRVRTIYILSIST